MTQLKLGTRGSQLALAQAETIAKALRANGHEVEIVKIVTTGDRIEGPVAEPRADAGLVVVEEERILAGPAGHCIDV